MLSVVMDCTCEKSLETGCCLDSKCLFYLFFELGQRETVIGNNGSNYKLSDIKRYINDLNNKSIYNVSDLQNHCTIFTDLVNSYEVSKDIAIYFSKPFATSLSEFFVYNSDTKQFDLRHADQQCIYISIEPAPLIQLDDIAGSYPTIF